MADNTTNAPTYDGPVGRSGNGRMLPTPRTNPLLSLDDGDPADLATIGVEEEFHVVDLHTRELVPRAGELLDRLPAASFSAELHRSVVETNTAVCRTLDELRAELTRLRQAAVQVAEPARAGHRRGRHGPAGRPRRRLPASPPPPATGGCSTSTSCSPASS